MTPLFVECVAVVIYPEDCSRLSYNRREGILFVRQKGRLTIVSFLISCNHPQSDRLPGNRVLTYQDKVLKKLTSSLE